jgi:ABC-type Fe3+/spermidine/putrescine transport system ATPase subunit
MSFLSVEGVSKRYKGESEPVLEGLDFALEKGEIVVLLGSSGCGKTTLLKIIAGLEAQDEGTVSIDGECMDGILPERRPISMVFQKALLFRNMTVAQNVDFAPRVNRSLPRAELAERTERMLELVGMAGMGRKRATEISGGQEQRVSLARALMVNPKLLLLDEPLSALDAALRRSMQAYIRELNRATGVTMTFVTHDQAEAVAVADRIALMHRGQIVQFAKPREFYTKPASQYVASFFGWQNFVPAVCKGGRMRSALGEFELAGLAGDATGEREGLLVMRPEAASVVEKGGIECSVLSASYLGADIVYRVACAGLELELRLPVRHDFAVGQRFKVSFDPTMLWFVKDSGELAYADEQTANEALKEAR